MILRRIVTFFKRRVVLVALAIIAQFLCIIFLTSYFKASFVYIYLIFILISLIVYVYILNSKTNPNYKIAWISIVLLFPLFGGLMYILLKNNRLANYAPGKIEAINTEKYSNLVNDELTLKKLYKENEIVAHQAYYISKHGNNPLYFNTKSKYYKIGQAFFIDYIAAIKKAQKYIFLEYYIIKEGKMWNEILAILKEKVKAGIDVRIIYDDIGCILHLPTNYNLTLEALGIKCRVFNPFVPILSTKLNNRSHRKMTIIDGNIAFTGGINLADEYINEVERFGNWKDNAVRLEGPAAFSFTTMFLSMWEYLTGIEEDYSQYYPQIENHHKNCGYIQPYDGNPLLEENIGFNVYLNLINKAKRKIYIMTPYLIIDEGLLNALCLASKNGVVVKIITPGIPDKKIVNELTKGYYNILLENGIHIYEYQKGFVHSKVFLIDDSYATVGTFNVDYRSLYLHFECGVWLYKTASIKDIVEDFDETFNYSKEILLIDNKKIWWFRRMVRSILRVFATLM